MFHPGETGKPVSCKLPHRLHLQSSATDGFIHLLLRWNLVHSPFIHPVHVSTWRSPLPPPSPCPVMSVTMVLVSPPPSACLRTSCRSCDPSFLTWLSQEPDWILCSPSSPPNKAACICSQLHSCLQRVVSDCCVLMLPMASWVLLKLSLPLSMFIVCSAFRNVSSFYSLLTCLTLLGTPFPYLIGLGNSLSFKSVQNCPP